MSFNLFSLSDLVSGVSKIKLDKRLFSSLLAVALLLPATASARSTQVGLTAGQFAVDESGAASYSLPLNLPEGRAGVKPQVALSYSSSNAFEGPLGVGWSISGLSSISRCPWTPVHDNGEIRAVQFDNQDKFCLNGQRLLLKSGTYGAAGSTYYTEVDNFALITAHGGTASAGPAYFTVEDRAGDTYYFGNANAVNEAFRGVDAYVEPGGFAEGSIAKNWALKIIKDVKGNYIRYNYNENTTDGTFYVDSIDYAGWTDGSDNQNPFASVEFVYDDYEKGFVGYMSGSMMYHNKLLTRIDTKTDNDVFRSYHLNYERSTAIEEKNPSDVSHRMY